MFLYIFILYLIKLIECVHSVIPCNTSFKDCMYQSVNSGWWFPTINVLVQSVEVVCYSLGWLYLIVASFLSIDGQVMEFFEGDRQDECSPAYDSVNYVSFSIIYQHTQLCMQLPVVCKHVLPTATY